MAKTFFGKFSDPNQGLDISGWSRPAAGFGYDYINHYNTRYNSCFVLIRGDNLIEQTYGLYNVIENKWDASKISSTKGDTCSVFDIRNASGSANQNCADYNQFVHDRMEGSEIN